MSELELAVINRGGNAVEDDCPLCLEPLPPFWDTERRVIHVCCGKETCKDCNDKENEFLDRAEAEGKFGKGEEQLQGFCSLCRTSLPYDDQQGKILREKFEEGRLPLHLHRVVALNCIKGRGGVVVDVERGVEILILGAKKGDPNCQFLLGNACWEGDYGLAKSSDDAKLLFLAATEQGHAGAEYCLALVAKDEGNDTEFLKYTRSSASKGYENACYDLGIAYYNGEYGLQKSTEEAIRMLTPAAQRGDAASMGLLGEIMVYPDPDSESSVEPWNNPNFIRGIHWIRRAAAIGDEDAISEMEELEEFVSSMCFMCNKKAPIEKAFLRCSRCRAAWYCSKDCQRQHWKAEAEGRKLLRYNFFMLQADVLPNMGLSATRKRLIHSHDCTSDSNFATKKRKDEVDGGGYDFSSGEL